MGYLGMRMDSIETTGRGFWMKINVDHFFLEKPLFWGIFKPIGVSYRAIWASDPHKRIVEFHGNILSFFDEL